MSSCQHGTDVKDLKLKFSRFLRFAPLIKSHPVYLGKSPKLRIFSVCQSASRNGLVLAQILAHSRSGVSKIEAPLSYVDDKTLLYLAEVLKVQLQELFPTRPPGNRIYDFIEKLETTRF